MSAISKSALSRADLLRVLVLQDEQALQKMAFALGYQQAKVEQVEKKQTRVPEILAKSDKSKLVVKAIARPDKKLAASFFYIAQRERKPPDDQPITPEIPEFMQQGDILTEDACADSVSLTLPPYSPLIRWSRLWPFLRRVLGQHYESRKPDIPRLINHVAKGITLRQLPMQTQHSWSPNCCLLLDFNPHTQAYYLDYTDLQTRLTKMHGELGLELRILEGAAGLQTQYRKASKNEVLSWGMPAVDSPLLILSDLGLLAESPQLKQGWEQFGRRLRTAQCKAHVLCPVPPSLIDKNLQGLFTIHSWDKNSRLQGQSTVVFADDLTDKAQQKQQGVETLLALLSIAIVIEPGLLRAIRNLLAADQVNVADEAGFWHHADISSSTQGCCFKALAGVQQYQQRLQTDDFWHTLKLTDSAEQQRFKQRLVSDIHKHHAYLPQSVRMMEMDQCERVLPGTVDQQTLIDIKRWKQAMAKTCYQQTDHQNLQVWNQYYIASLPAIMFHNPQIAVLWACAQRQRLERGEIIHYPEAVKPTDVDFILSGRGHSDSLQCHLFQTGQELRISEKVTDTELLGSYYADLVLDGDLSIKTEYPYSQAQQGQWQWQSTIESFSKGNSKVIIELGQTLRQLSFTNSRETLVLKSLTKPDWATQIGRDSQGLWLEFEQHQQFWRVYWPAWGGELGYDQYGLYNDLNIKGVIQRSRWIPPGTFKMGSPESEQKREDDETRHQVTLTQGYWLSDTACTQALWLAVMRENPASFKADENNPVENISWDNAQVFLQQLNSLIPGLAATLPTEAQWEYACRAGTNASFSFGENITPEQVNYNGEYPYADGKIGLNREATLPVKSLPANPWGLYEMHGNVLEWCQDWYGQYLNTAETDPPGAKNGSHRVLRGGSWISGGRDSRSASRYTFQPDDRGNFTGFRFAPGQANSQEAEPVFAASERGKQPEKGGPGLVEKIWDKVRLKK